MRPFFVFLLLAILLVGCGGSSSTQAPTKGPWFRDAAADSGLTFEHNPGAKGQFVLPEIIGSGAALLDYDGDGDLDALLLQGSPDGGSHKLYRNDLIPGGKLHFTDVTQAAGLERRGIGMGVATGDFNNDGRPDLVITAYGANALYRNNGNGTFTDVTAESPEVALRDRWSTSATFIDYDRDGWLDLVTLNYLEYSPEIYQKCSGPAPKDYCTPRAYETHTPHLFRNDQGKFTEMTVKTKLSGGAGPGMGVVPVDANGDGWMDLIMANDLSANHFWINLKNGKFEENALQLATAYGSDGIAKIGRGVAAGDYDNDGDEDLVIANGIQEGASFFRNDGDKGFADIASASGILPATFTSSGFGLVGQDFDRDGWLDVLAINGSIVKPYEQKSQLFRNPGKPGEKFEAVPFEMPVAIGRAAAYGDIDNDGDIDVLINVNRGKVRLLLNETANRNWVAVQVDGAGMGEGSKVVVKASGMPVQTRTLRTGGGYLSANDARVYFGLGSAGSIESISITPAGQPAMEQKSPRVNTVVRFSAKR